MGKKSAWPHIKGQKGTFFARSLTGVVRFRKKNLLGET